VVVDHRLVDLAGLDGGDQRGAPGAERAGHHQVEPAVRRRSGRLGREPVRHQQPAPTPLALEDLVVDRPLLGRRDAVDPVVGRHHRPRVGVLDRDLERQQVELAQRPLVHDAVDAVPVGLGLVGDQVLQAGADAVRLQARDVRSSEVTGQQRVLGVGLEQAPAQRAAVEVDGGAQHHVDVLALGLLGEQPPDLRGRLGAPGGREQGGVREEAGERAAGEVQAAYAGRPVGERHRREPELVVAVQGEHRGTGQQLHLVLEPKAGHPLVERRVVHVLSLHLGGAAGRSRHPDWL